MDGLAENGDDKEESKIFMCSSPQIRYSRRHKVFNRLDDVCGDFVETEKHWSDNTCSVAVKVKEKVDEPWKKYVESEEEYYSTDLTFPFHMSLSTELYVADEVLVTCDGEPKVNDVLNCMESRESVAIAGFSKEEGKIVEALAEKVCRISS